MRVRQPSVADVMTVNITVIGVDATLTEADAALRSTVITGVPVIDNKGALVGVITDADLAAYRFSHRLEADGARTAAAGRSGEPRLPRSHAGPARDRRECAVSRR